MNRYARTLSLMMFCGAVALLIAANGAALGQNQELGSQSPQAPTGAQIIFKTLSVTAKQESPAKPDRPHAYHKEPPTAPLPATLDPQEVANRIQKPEFVPAAIVVYSIAAKIKDALYQVPCYCGCDKSIGHDSLLNCFTTFHGAGCPTCQMEAIYVFEQVKVGKKPPEIRDAMERGEWGSKVADYVKKHYPEYEKPGDKRHSTD